MKRLIYLLLLVLIVPTQGELYAAAKKKEKKGTPVEVKSTKKISPYEKLLGGKNSRMAKSDFITLHQVGDKVYVEIPLKYMGRDMLLASTVSRVSMPDFCDVGYKAKEPMHIKFTRQDSTVHLRSVTAYVDTDCLQQAIDLNYGDPVLYAYPVKAYNVDSSAVVIDMTPLLASNAKEFDVFGGGMMGGLLSISSSFKKEASSIQAIKAFDDNFSVKAELSYDISISLMGLVKLMDNAPFTMSVTRSLLLLPEEAMRPRITDSRVGVFNSTRMNITMKEDGIQQYSVAHRWRLEPRDEAAYRRGELVEPVQPIVFYVDDAFPELWKEPLKVGISRWNKAFESIGFKNVVRVLDFPMGDPSFDPDNLKYSCIRYLPSTTANAMGPSWTDPRSGEIINASVIVYNNIIELINNWRFVQTAQIDPSVRSKKMPDDIVKESIAYVVAHEVGHCLGFMHNMASSSCYPVDSLRSASFTREHGTTPCIMDYARFNYVAQPDDRGVALTPPDLGIYDYFLVKWNYQYLSGLKDAWEEQKVLEAWVDEKAGDPRYRYGRQQIQARFDPSAIEEDLGDDPVKASDYGIKNLKYILSNLNTWITDDPDYSHREGLYGQILTQYYRYVRNVMYNIGGIYLSEVKEGTPGERHVAVDKAKQKAALAWTINQVKNMDWLDNATLKKQFHLNVGGSYLCRARVAKDLKGLINNVILSSYVASSPYSIEEFMDDLYRATWENLLRDRALTKEDQVLQDAMVTMCCAAFPTAGGGKKSSPFGYAPSVDEMIAYGLDESGLVARFADQFRLLERENGVGFVSTRVLENRFGTPGYGWQRDVDVSTINNSNAYLQDMAVRSRDLLRGKVKQATGSTKVHYQALLIRLNDVLKDKL